MRLPDGRGDSPDPLITRVVQNSLQAFYKRFSGPERTQMSDRQGADARRDATSGHYVRFSSPGAQALDQESSGRPRSTAGSRPAPRPPLSHPHTNLSPSQSSLEPAPGRAQPCLLAADYPQHSSPLLPPRAARMPRRPPPPTSRAFPASPASG